MLRFNFNFPGRYSYFLPISFYILIITSCTKQNEETLIRKQGVTPCDTAMVTYNAKVLAIIQTNCYSCHSGAELSANINLEGHDNLKVQADNNNLINVITHAPGYPAMPLNLPKLSDCDINTIRIWINQGAPDN